MENFTPKQIGIGIAGVVITLVLLYGAWKVSTKPVAAEKYSISRNEKDHTLGNTNSKVMLVEYSDLQCPACKAFSPVINQLVKNNKDKMFFIYRHFPLQQHKNGRAAALASEAASKQGKFFEMHDIMFEHQSDWENSNKPQEIFTGYAKELKLNLDTFKKDLDAGDSNDKIDADMRTGVEYRITATPTFFLDGVKINLPGSLEEFQKLIDQEVAKSK